MTETLTVQDLIAKIRIWQTAAARYDEACEEARQINDGKHYPSSPGRRAAIKVLDAAAMDLIHDVHNDAVLEMLITLADEVDRLRRELEWYADGSNYRRAITQFACAVIDDDGERARTALKGDKWPSNKS